MTAHDPICPELKFGEKADMDWPSECQCDLIAKVRADERAKYQCPMPCCDEEASHE